MFQLSNKSKELLASCDPRLQKICSESIKIFDFTVLQGHRGKEQQDQFFSSGKSKLKFPKSKHNSQPSLAVDIAPYPINFNDPKRFYFLAGIIQTIAAQQNIKIRWGGDWNQNLNFSDENFYDLVHFEIVE